MMIPRSFNPHRLIGHQRYSRDTAQHYFSRLDNLDGLGTPEQLEQEAEPRRAASVDTGPLDLTTSKVSLVAFYIATAAGIATLSVLFLGMIALSNGAGS